MAFFSRQPKHPQIIEHKQIALMQVHSKLFGSKKAFLKDLDNIFGKKRENLVKSFMGIVPIYKVVAWARYQPLNPSEINQWGDEVRTTLELDVIANEQALKRLSKLPSEDKTFYKGNGCIVTLRRDNLIDRFQQDFASLVSSKLERYMSMSGDIKAVKHPSECPSCSAKLTPHQGGKNAFINGSCSDCGYHLFNFTYEDAKRIFYKTLEWQEKSGKEIFTLVDES